MCIRDRGGTITGAHGIPVTADTAVEQVILHSGDMLVLPGGPGVAALEGSDTLRMTHETIGRHLGSPREVVTRMLRYFQGEGLVRLARGSVELTGRERLRELAEG